MHPAAARAACLAAVVLAMALVAAIPSHAQQQGEAEQRLEKVRRELQQVAAERRKAEGERGEAVRALRAADEKVAAASRALRETAVALQQATARLDALGQERELLGRDLEGSRGELAHLLRAAHAQGEAAPLKLLLAQDRVADAKRLLAYHGYLQRDRVRRIRELGQALARLDELEAGIAAQRELLEKTRAEQQDRLAALEAERRNRGALVTELEARYTDSRQREQALGRDAQSLEKLLARLREAARAAAEAEAKAEAARRAAAGPDRGPAKPPAPATGPRVGGGRWPVDGRLLAGYGKNMPDGRSSRGLLIGAPAGSPVRAAASGTVVYAEWMSGFGLILIIDHGDGHMSLYAHNESLLREPGERVAQGDQVATVGSSGGHGQPALYFELRRGGAPVDPGSWLKR